jgi:hypothetical protein
LWVIIILNIFSLTSSLIFNNYLYGGNKWEASPFNFFWEWITVFWCVWSSILTCFYCAIELKNNLNKRTRKRQQILGLVVVIGNLLSMIFFASYLPKQLSEQGITRGAFWWTYSIVWHFIAIPLNLFYFFKFAEFPTERIYQKKTFVYLVIQPVLFFLANLIRKFSVEEKYLVKPWKKYMIPMFGWVDQEEYGKFLLFAFGALFAFWLIGWGLVKMKRLFCSLSNKNVIRKK